MITFILRIFLTILVYIVGNYIGALNQRIESDCIPVTNAQNLRSSEANSHSMETNNFLNAREKLLKATKAYIHIIRDQSVLTSVLDMIHHPASAVQAETILTTHSEFQPNFASCERVLTLRSPVRTDHPNRCIAIARVHNEINANSTYSPLTHVNHRLGDMEWPQVLSNQYQVRFSHIYCT